MPDPIRTNADLTRVQAYEAELKREIEQAKSFGTNYTAYEVRLKSVRADIEKFRATNRVANVSFEPKMMALNPKTPADKLADFVASIAASPLGFLGAGLTAVQNAAGFLTGLAQAQKNAAVAAREKERRNQGTNSTNPAAAPGQPGNQSPSNAAPSNSAAPYGTLSPLPPTPTNPAAPAGTNSPSAPFEIQTPGGNSTTNQPATNDSFPAAADDFAPAAGQTEALQSVGGRLQAALEQNAFVTNALFQQTLELINRHNQKLGDVDRKISELTNQIKSLKNP